MVALQTVALPFMAIIAGLGVLALIGEHLQRKGLI
jgi:hypothetical protein